MGLPQGPTFLRFRSRLGKLSHKKKASNPACLSLHICSTLGVAAILSVKELSKLRKSATFPRPWRGAAALMVVRLRWSEHQPWREMDQTTKSCPTPLSKQLAKHLHNLLIHPYHTSILILFSPRMKNPDAQHHVREEHSSSMTVSDCQVKQVQTNHLRFEGLIRKNEKLPIRAQAVK